MPADLRQLAQITDDLRSAVEAGDLTAAEQMLARRERELGLLRGALEAGGLDGAQRELLEQIVSQGAAVARCLIARRETIRAEIAVVEGERRRLGGWAPAQPSSRLDLLG